MQFFSLPMRVERGDADQVLRQPDQVCGAAVDFGGQGCIIHEVMIAAVGQGGKRVPADTGCHFLVTGGM